MKFWSSAEISPEAGDAYRSIRKPAEKELNFLLANVGLDECWTDWRWTFIAIILSPIFTADFPERVRRSNKRKDLEFRLQISFSEFLAAPHSGKVRLVFEQLHRSVDLMAKWKMSAVDREKLHRLLDQVEVAPSVQAIG